MFICACHIRRLDVGRRELGLVIENAVNIMVAHSNI